MMRIFPRSVCGMISSSQHEIKPLKESKKWHTQEIIPLLKEAYDTFINDWIMNSLWKVLPVGVLAPSN